MLCLEAAGLGPACSHPAVSGLPEPGAGDPALVGAEGEAGGGAGEPGAPEEQRGDSGGGSGAEREIFRARAAGRVSGGEDEEKALSPLQQILPQSFSHRGAAQHPPQLLRPLHANVLLRHSNDDRKY